MQYKKEVIHFPEEFPCRIFENRRHQEQMHFHDCLEINYILNGSGSYRIEEREYEIHTGDIFVINNYERHMAVFEDEIRILVLIFPPEFIWGNSGEMDLLKPFFNRSQSFSNRISPQKEIYSILQQGILSIYEEYQKQKPGWKVMIKAQTQLFLAGLYRAGVEKKEIEADSVGRQHSLERMRPVLDYIREHFSEPIELDTLAQIAVMNRTYFCSYFKEQMHLRVFEYIDQVRMQHASMLLKTTQMNITEVAFASGYNTISYFNRSFKRVFGMTPGQYRKIEKDGMTSEKGSLL